jgi:hypothetical protein
VDQDLAMIRRPGVLGGQGCAGAGAEQNPPIRVNED